AKVGEMIELTGLGMEQHKKIGSLSKGYRQRVGLAQALIHDPEVLILDEPTSGLDPNQLADIRQLIINLGKEKTVILSTHIMQEVEAVCDNVVIIDQGSIVANGSLQDLKEKAGSSGVQITVGFNEHIDLRKHFRMDDVKSIKKGEREHEWVVTTTPDVDLRPDLFRFAVDKKLVLLELSRNAYEVEDVFRLLTK
ncbi:MAG: ABC-2 type transport system ATP-binding protein, partial [Maribacter sp.]